MICHNIGHPKLSVCWHEKNIKDFFSAREIHRTKFAFYQFQNTELTFFPVATWLHLKFRYSEKGTNLKKSSTYNLTLLSSVKCYKWKIFSNFVAFSEYLNFNRDVFYLQSLCGLYLCKFFISLLRYLLSIKSFDCLTFVFA